jgi:hypothetical protein
MVDSSMKVAPRVIGNLTIPTICDAFFNFFVTHFWILWRTLSFYVMHFKLLRDAFLNIVTHFKLLRDTF